MKYAGSLLIFFVLFLDASAWADEAFYVESIKRVQYDVTDAGATFHEQWAVVTFRKANQAAVNSQPVCQGNSNFLGSYVIYVSGAPSSSPLFGTEIAGQYMLDMLQEALLQFRAFFPTAVYLPDYSVNGNATNCLITSLTKSYDYGGL